MKSDFAMRTTVLILLIASGIGLSAQQVVKLDEVIESALNHNFQIRILRNNNEIVENQANRGNAGMLPNVTANGAYSINSANTQLEFAGDIPPVDQSGAIAENSSASVNLNYTLFNGFRVANTFDRLRLNSYAVETQSRASIEAIIIQTAQAFINWQRSNNHTRIAEENVAISGERFERAELTNEFGTSARTELLSARVDLTNDSTSLLQAQLTESQSIRNLERLTGTEIADGSLPEEIEVELSEFTIESLKQQATQNNAALKNAQLQTELAKKDLKIASAYLYPILALNGGYSYNRNVSEVGIILENVNTGPNASLTLTYPLFSGFTNKINRENSKIVLENRQLELEDAQLQLEVDLENTWEAYQQQLRVYYMETANLEAAQLNLDRSEELFKNGNATNTQFREAQLNLALSKDRINAAASNVKLSELQLLMLSGLLLKQ